MTRNMQLGEYPSRHVQQQGTEVWCWRVAPQIIELLVTPLLSPWRTDTEWYKLNQSWNRSTLQHLLLVVAVSCRVTPQARRVGGLIVFTRPPRNLAAANDGSIVCRGRASRRPDSFAEIRKKHFIGPLHITSTCSDYIATWAWPLLVKGKGVTKKDACTAEVKDL